MLPDELTETLRRTEVLAIQSALALCLACELIERFNRSAANADEPGLNDLRDQVHRVSDALGTVLELVHADDSDEGLSAFHRSATNERRLN